MGTQHFIQEKDPVLGKTDFTGLGDCTAPDHGDVADRMVWVAIGSGPDQSIPLGQSRNRVQFGRLQAFLKCHRGQDPKESLGQHCLAGTGRSDHQKVMPPCCGNLQGSACASLTVNIRQVGDAVFQLHAGQFGRRKFTIRTDDQIAIEKPDDVGQRVDRKDFHFLDRLLLRHSFGAGSGP